MSFRSIGVNSRVYVGDCDVGKGVFALEAIAEGEVILEFGGPLGSASDLLGIEARAEAAALQIDEDSYVLLEPPGALVNHSCEPNGGIRSTRTLVALNDIRAGMEIRFDYSTSIGRNDAWQMRCRCGSPSCRHVIGPFVSLPKELRQRYRQAGIVQEFALREEDALEE